MTEASSTSALCTLYDGDYHLGVGALANSLFAQGFRGCLWVGYRDRVPPWAVSQQAGLVERDSHQVLTLDEGFQIAFVKFNPKGHLTNFKAAFMLEVLESYAPEARAVFYFDVDIVVILPWSYYEAWVDQGVGLCMDVNEHHMAPNHPLRGPWRAFAEKAGFTCRDVWGYFNGGFVCVPREHRAFVRTWQRLIDRLPDEGRSLDVFHGQDRSDIFMAADQDLLNIAAMASDAPLIVAGPEAMGFTQAGSAAMLHAVMTPKPWRKAYLAEALRGNPPNRADKAYWEAVAQPIAIFSPGEIAKRRRALKLASALGRVYRRT